MTDSSAKKDELEGTEQPFVQHLVELRDRMIKAMAAIGIAAAFRFDDGLDPVLWQVETTGGGGDFGGGGGGSPGGRIGRESGRAAWRLEA
jgi:hypothetical protein